MANTRGKRQETNPVDETMTTGYVEFINDEPAAKTPSIKKGVVHNCINLNVRKEPTKSAPVLNYIPAGTNVKVLSEANDEWYKVHADGVGTGFCMKEFIKIGK